MGTTKENRDLFAKAETPAVGGNMETPKYNINAMGNRPMSGDSSQGGNDGRDPVGAVRPTGIVATGRFGGSANTGSLAGSRKSARKMSGGRSMGR